MDVTLCGRYYERFADHAVSVGKRMVFQVVNAGSEVFGDRRA